MGTRELSLGRARRRRWLTGLLMGGILATALAVGLTYWRSANHAAPDVHTPPSPAADVQQQRTGLTFTRSDGPRPVFTVHAARTISYQKSKSTVLEDVTVEIFGPKGDGGDILRTKRCEYNPQSGDFFGSGPVQIELSTHSGDTAGAGSQHQHRIFLETSKVSYEQGDELAVTEQPVTFKYGPASGTAVGMVYATRDGWLELKHDVSVDWVEGTGKAPQPPIHLTASALRYEKDSQRVLLSGPVAVTDGQRRATADTAVINLDAHNRVSRADLEGHAKAFDSSRKIGFTGGRMQGDFDPATGELRHLTAEKDVTGESQSKASLSHLAAQRVDMVLTGKHPEPLGGSATGNVHISLESQAVLNTPNKIPGGKSPEKKTLAAREVDFRFRPRTFGLLDARTAGPGTLLLASADPKAGEKVITAGQFLMTFDARSHLDALHGAAPTEVTIHPPAQSPAGTPLRQTRADHLEAAFDPVTQLLREIRQTGDFQYRDGDRQAGSEGAVYDAQAQTMVLRGHPAVWNPDSRVRAQSIMIDMRTNTATADGHVQATHLPSPPAGKSPSATPPMPTNVLADKMVAQRQNQYVRYEGHVRAWQGTDVVESSALDVYRTQRRVSSGSHVLTSFLQPAAMVGSATGTPHASDQMRPVTIQADNLEYLDAGRRARYSGNVRLMTETTTLKSDRLDVYFNQGATVEGSQVDHAVAEGHVRVTQPGRLGTGDRAEYFAGPGKIILTGGQPMVIDEEKGSTTGQRLTFFIHDDRLFVDGGDQTPSISRHRVNHRVAP